MKPRNHTILALDPGLRDLGYAVLRGKHLVTANVLSLRNVLRSRRLSRVREELTALIRGYRPQAIAIEEMPQRSLDKVAGLPALGRLVRKLARRRRLKLAAYSARTVRRSVVGNGWAGKRETAEAMVARFPDLRVQLTQNRKWKEAYWQNMYDASAIGIHHQLITKPPSRSR